MTIIAPSLLSSDTFQLEKQLQEIKSAGANYLHVDVMDGHYVSNINFGPKYVKDLRPHTDLTLDCHVMAEQPEAIIDSLMEAGADIITFHPETTRHAYRLIEHIHEQGKKAGIAFDPSVAIAAYRDLLPLADQVLIMTVTPGFGGQKFIPDMLEKVQEVTELKAQNYYGYDIEVDGGINDKTGSQCKKAGANVLVAGSYVFAGSIKENIAQLK